MTHKQITNEISTTHLLICAYCLSGVTSPPVALWDVDGDGLEDVLIGVTNISNDSQPMNSQNKREQSGHTSHELQSGLDLRGDEKIDRKHPTYN